MRFGLLGELEIEGEGGPVAIAAPRQRALLALLLLHRGTPVAVDRLAAELWGDRAPATAVKTVQVYVAQLRKAIGEGVVVTHGHAYLVDLAGHELDVARFEQLAAHGRELLAEGDAEGAAATLGEALALWRGSPLADFTYEEFAQAEIARLEELRLSTVEARIDADLLLGRHLGAAGELEVLVRAHPEREHFVGQMMVALYRSGRQTEALDAYQQVRRTLVDTLGIEPGRSLRELEKAILNQDPSLDLVPSGVEPVEATLGLRGAFVGREPEMQELLDGLRDSLAGHGRLFLLIGEPGIGKSRLAEELVAHARGCGAQVLVGRCWEAGGAPAYWPWVQALRAYVLAAEPETLQAQLGAGGGDLAQLLPELREILPELPEPPVLESEGARFRLFDAATEFLRNASAGCPIVLVLDDLHAADEPSLLLLRFLAREIGSSHLLLLGALRDVDPLPGEPLTALLAEVTRDAAVHRLALAGLSERAVARYVELTASEIATPEVVQALYEETEGNPLFVSEMVRLLALEHPRQDDPRARISLPPSVHQVITRRLAHLSDDCNGMLTLASVLGREFALPILAQMAVVAEDELLETLDEALVARILSDVPGESDRLRFAHVLIRDILYEGLTPARRIRLHRMSAAAIEAVRGAAAGPHLAELAHHAIAGNDFARGLDYARRAGDRAAALLAYEEAARLYDLAIDILQAHRVEDDVEHCELLLRLGDVQARGGDIPAAKASFVRAAEVARSAGMPYQLARAALGYGGRFVWTRPWGDQLVVPLLEEALAALPEEDSDLRARLLARLSGGALRDTLAVGPRVAMAQQALEMARRLGDRTTLAYTLSGRHCANWGADALAERIATAAELVEVAESAGDPERAYEGHDFLYIARFEAGDVRAARKEHAIKASLAQELRQPAQLWDWTVNQAQLLLFEGRFEEGDAAIREALGLGRSAQSANAQVGFELQMYSLRRELGRLDEALDAVERAVDEYPAYPIWRYVCVDVLAQLDRKDEAQAAFDALAAEGFPVPVEMQWLCSLDMLTDPCRYLAAAGRGATLYSLLVPYAGRVVLTPPELNRGSSSRGLGLLAATMANWDAATKHFEAALEQNQRLGSPPWVAHTQDDYARMLVERGAPGDLERAEQLLDGAIVTYRELGMQSYEARARKACRSSSASAS